MKEKISILRNHFKGINPTTLRHVVEAEKISLNPPFDMFSLYLHQSVDKKTWEVSEKTTGITVVHGLYSPTDAVKMAISTIHKHGVHESFKQICEATKARPLFKQKAA